VKVRLGIEKAQRRRWALGESSGWIRMIKQEI
jgi:hypothetical protein